MKMPVFPYKVIRRLFIATFLFCIATIIACIVCNQIKCLHLTAEQETPGEFTLDQSENAYMTNISLAGKWEYFPNQLILSDTYDDHLPGELLSFNLGQALSGNFSSSKALTFSDDYSEDAASYISVPNAFDSVESGLLSAPSVASYHITIHGCRSTGNDNLMISFPGLLSGNYKVYINHKEVTMRMPTPWGYPIYTFDDEETVDIIIEVTDSTHILNVAPLLTSVDGAMRFFDNTKNTFLVLAATLLTVLIVFIIFILFIEAKPFHPYFVVGFIYCLYFILSTSWGSGYLDDITKIIPFFSINIICSLLLLVGQWYAFYTLWKRTPNVYKRRLFHATTAIICALAVFELFRLFSPLPGMIYRLSPFVLSGVAGIWIMVTCRHFQDFKPEDILFQFGFLAILLGSHINQIYNLYGVIRQQIYVLPICIILYIVCIMNAIRLNQKMVLEHTRALLALEKETTKMQTSMLTNQMKPHFIFNTLTTIQELCYRNPKSAVRLIARFSKYLRTNIDFMDYSDLIPFSHELEHIENYMYIQNARFENSLHFEKNIKVTDFMIPPLSIQPLVENGIKYGIRQNANSGNICLSTSLEENWLLISVYNSGAGFSETSLKKNHSIDNIRTRMKTLLNATLTIHSDANQSGTTVEIRIPKANILTQDSPTDHHANKGELL